jgi:hypothetical protein
MAKNERVEVAPKPSTDRRVAVGFDGTIVMAGESKVESTGGFMV